MFAHEFILEQGVDIKAVQEDLGRFYICPGDAKYPSVTTVLGSKPEKKASIASWRKRVGAAEADRISNEAATQGTAMHLMCERYLLNQDDYLETTDPFAPEMFSKIKPLLDKHLSVVHALEAPLWSHRLKVAGRVDCCGIWDGKRSIIDFKTSMKPKRKEWIEDYFKQATCYACMWEEVTGWPVPQIVILISVRNSSPQVFVEKRNNWLEKLVAELETYHKEKLF